MKEGTRQRTAGHPCGATWAGEVWRRACLIGSVSPLLLQLSLAHGPRPRGLRPRLGVVISASQQTSSDEVYRLIWTALYVFICLQSLSIYISTLLFCRTVVGETLVFSTAVVTTFYLSFSLPSL